MSMQMRNVQTHANMSCCKDILRLKLSTSSVCARKSTTRDSDDPASGSTGHAFPTTAQSHPLPHLLRLFPPRPQSTTTTRTKKRGRLLSTTKTLPSLPRRPSSHPSSCRRHCRPRPSPSRFAAVGSPQAAPTKRAQMMTKIETVRERVAAVQHRARGWSGEDGGGYQTITSVARPSHGRPLLIIGTSISNALAPRATAYSPRLLIIVVRGSRQRAHGRLDRRVPFPSFSPILATAGSLPISTPLLLLHLSGDPGPAIPIPIRVRSARSG